MLSTLIEQIKNGDEEAKNLLLFLYQEQVDKMSEEYDFLMEDSNQLKDLFVEELINSSQTYKEDSELSFGYYFKSQMYQKTLEMVRAEMEEKEISDIARRFIDKQLLDQSLKPDLLVKFRIIGKFLRDINPEFFFNNSTLYLNHEEVMKKKMKLLIGKVIRFTIDKSRINLITDDPLVRSLIETYCEVEDIMVVFQENKVKANKGKDLLPTTNAFLDMVSCLPKIELTMEEETRLALLAKNGDREARHTLILSQASSAVMFSRKAFQFWGLERNDMFQNLMLGISVAVDKFDPTMGYRFSTFASYYFKKYMIKPYLETGKMIRLPRLLEEKMTAYRKEVQGLEKILGYSLSVDEIESYTDYTRKEVLKFFELSQPIMSLQTPVGFEDGTLEDFIMDTKSTIDQNHMVEAFYQDVKESLLKVLTTDEYQFLCEFYGLEGQEPIIQRELAKKYGYSQNTVSKKCRCLLKKVFSSSEAKNLAVYLSDINEDVLMKSDLRRGIDKLTEKRKKLRKLDPASNDFTRVVSMIECLEKDFVLLNNRFLKDIDYKNLTNNFYGRTEEQILSVLDKLTDESKECYKKFYIESSGQVLKKNEKKYVNEKLIPEVKILLQKQYGSLDNGELVSSQSMDILVSLGIVEKRKQISSKQVTGVVYRKKA